MSYLFPLLITLAACFSLQSLALQLTGGSTIKSESNYYSSIARLQNGFRKHPKVLLLGSSRIARLPVMPSRGEGIVNMGCDGGSAAITLRAIDRGIIPSAPVIVIEGNTLLHDLEKRGHQIFTAMESPWFQIGNQLSNVAATSRPSAIVYSALLGKRIFPSTTAEGPAFPISIVAKCPTQPSPLPSDASTLVQELSEILMRLREGGHTCMLVMLPPASPSNSLNYTIPRELSRISGAPLLDLTRDLPIDAVHYTDGIHMAPDSAAAALRTILSALNLP